MLRIADQYPTGGIDQVREILWNPRRRSRLLRPVRLKVADTTERAHPVPNDQAQHIQNTNPYPTVRAEQPAMQFRQSRGSVYSRRPRARHNVGRRATGKHRLRLSPGRGSASMVSGGFAVDS